MDGLRHNSHRSLSSHSITGTARLASCGGAGPIAPSVSDPSSQLPNLSLSTSLPLPYPSFSYPTESGSLSVSHRSDGRSSRLPSARSTRLPTPQAHASTTGKNIHTGSMQAGVKEMSAMGAQRSVPPPTTQTVQSVKAITRPATSSGSTGAGLQPPCLAPVSLVAPHTAPPSALQSSLLASWNSVASDCGDREDSSWLGRTMDSQVEHHVSVCAESEGSDGDGYAERL
jgi:hypothetical protein